jgi:hypothetical protein
MCTEKMMMMVCPEQSPHRWWLTGHGAANMTDDPATYFAIVPLGRDEIGPPALTFQQQDENPRVLAFLVNIDASLF